MFKGAVALASFMVGVALSQTLTVNKLGDGTGRVVSSPSGIDCGSTCSATFTSGTNVSLWAKADAGSIFFKWLGDCSSCEASVCNVTMTANKTCTAVFVDVRPAPPATPPPTSTQIDPQYTRVVNTPAGAIRVETSSPINGLSQQAAGFSPPEGFVTTYGAIRITLNSNKGYETLRIVFPRLIPPGSRIYKVVGESLYDITSMVSIQGSTITYIIYDNSWMDSSPTPGIIEDPMVLLENTSMVAGGGGGGCSTGAGGGWIALIGIWLMRFLRGRRKSP
ncbi:MAG: hypothetical protein N2648_01860 [Aquificaceae bacterium]|nr:hypothetical protein [Aquificaceae bacterium]